VWSSRSFSRLNERKGGGGGNVKNNKRWHYEKTSEIMETRVCREVGKASRSGFRPPVTVTEKRGRGTREGKRAVTKTFRRDLGGPVRKGEGKKEGKHSCFTCQNESESEEKGKRRQSALTLPLVGARRCKFKQIVRRSLRSWIGRREEAVQGEKWVRSYSLGKEREKKRGESSTVPTLTGTSSRGSRINGESESQRSYHLIYLLLNCLRGTQQEHFTRSHIRAKENYGEKKKREENKISIGTAVCQVLDPKTARVCRNRLNILFLSYLRK